MDLSQTLDYYPRDDSKFIDPLYQPYQKVKLYTNPEETSFVNVYPWEKKNIEEKYGKNRYPDIKGLTYLRVNPVNPCMPGYVDIGNGYCKKEERYDTFFYTKEHDDKNPFFIGYGEDLRAAHIDKNGEKDSSLRNFSVNPHTGRRIEYHSRRSSKTDRYKINRTNTTNLATFV